MPIWIICCSFAVKPQTRGIGLALRSIALRSIKECICPSRRSNLVFLRAASAGARLADAFAQEKAEGAHEVRRCRVMRWSILQHYELCPTPFLDFTQSLGVASSFATMATDAEPHDCVSGLPYPRRARGQLAKKPCTRASHVTPAKL